MTSQSPRTQHVSPDKKINQKVTYKIYVEGSRCDCLFLHCSYDFHSRPYFRRLLKASLFQLCRALMNPSQKTPNLTKKQNQVNYRAELVRTPFFLCLKEGSNLFNLCWGVTTMLFHYQ